MATDTVRLQNAAGLADVGHSSGVLIVAWQNPDTRLIAPVGLLEHGDGYGYRFRYLRRAKETPDFLPFLSFPRLDGTYVSENLFPLFSQRVMSIRRRDYGEFVRQLALSESEASPWEQLARSEGRSTGDTVQVFPVPTVSADGSTTCRFLVHGIRHLNDGVLPQLQLGERLALRDQIENAKYPDAILVCTQDGRDLGWVPDLLLEHLRALRRTGDVRLSVERVNGPEVPTHLRLLVRLDGTVPPGYQPMTGPQWETF
jgi:hypothetical protein